MRHERVTLLLLLPLLLVGCGEKWDPAAIAREQCVLSEMEARVKTRDELRAAEKHEAEFGHVRKHPEFSKEIADAIEKSLTEKRARAVFDRDAYIAACEPFAAKAIEPCVKDFRPGTGSADECVRRAASDAQLVLVTLHKLIPP